MLDFVLNAGRVGMIRRQTQIQKQIFTGLNAIPIKADASAGYLFCGPKRHGGKVRIAPNALRESQVTKAISARNTLLTPGARAIRPALLLNSSAPDRLRGPACPIRGAPHATEASLCRPADLSMEINVRELPSRSRLGTNNPAETYFSDPSPSLGSPVARSDRPALVPGGHCFGDLI